jgi:hypothetical protein
MVLLGLYYVPPNNYKKICVIFQIDNQFIKFLKISSKTSRKANNITHYYIAVSKKLKIFVKS